MRLQSCPRALHWQLGRGLWTVETGGQTGGNRISKDRRVDLRRSGPKERLGPSYFFIPLVLGPLNSLIWWEVPLGYIVLG
jgi:hypothetical protein